MWMLSYGDFDTEGYDTTKWVLFVIATIFLPLMLLNLLIAIVSDTFDRVYSNRVSSDYKELASLILEQEYLMFWNRSKAAREYLHIIKYKGVDILEGDEWDGRMNMLRKEITKRFDQS